MPPPFTVRFLLLASETVDGRRRGPGHTITETVFSNQFRELNLLDFKNHLSGLNGSAESLAGSYDTLAGQKAALLLAGRLEARFLITATTHITSGNPPEGSKLQPRLTAMGIKILDQATGRLLFAHGGTESINVADPGGIQVAIEKSLVAIVRALHPRVLAYFERHLSPSPVPDSREAPR